MQTNKFASVKSPTPAKSEARCQATKCADKARPYIDIFTHTYIHLDTHHYSTYLSTSRLPATDNRATAFFVRALGQQGGPWRASSPPDYLPTYLPDSGQTLPHAPCTSYSPKYVCRYLPVTPGFGRHFTVSRWLRPNALKSAESVVTRARAVTHPRPVARSAGEDLCWMPADFCIEYICRCSYAVALPLVVI